MARYLTLDMIKKVSPNAPKAKKVYSLFRRDLNGRYIRLTETAYSWDAAKFVYQDRLVAAHNKGSHFAIRQVTE